MRGKVKGISIIFCCLDALRNAGIALFLCPAGTRKGGFIAGDSFLQQYSRLQIRKLSALAAAASRSPGGCLKIV